MKQMTDILNHPTEGETRDFPWRDDMVERWTALSRAIAAADRSRPGLAGGELTVIGSGIRFSDFLADAEAQLRDADVVFYCLYEPVSQAWLHSLRPDAYDLRVLYDQDLDRFGTYARMAEAMLYFVRQGKKVAAVYYGHPGLFATPTHRAIKIARREGYQATMRPGISALDYLIADVGFDPALPGMQSFEATDMLLRKRRLDPSLHVILWQVGVVGELRFAPDGFENRGYDLLVSQLVDNYGEDAKVVHYVAPHFAGIDPLVGEYTIANLRRDEVKDQVSALSTFYLPPFEARETDAEMSVLLGIRQPDEPVPPPQSDYEVDRYSGAECAAIASLSEFSMDPNYRLPRPSAALEFISALSREPELARAYREDPAQALSDLRFASLGERSARLLSIPHPRSFMQAIREA